MRQHFDVIVVTTAADYRRVRSNYGRLVQLMPADRIIFVGNEEVHQLMLQETFSDRLSFVDENDILPFDEVHRIMQELLGTEQVPRGLTGWYYQQFLKMKYADFSDNEFYMSWDGDTVPTKRFEMFGAGGTVPYFDMKYEYHQEYFITLEKLLPGMQKTVNKSFISEHMLFNAGVMRELISEIESNASIPGTAFYEKILRAIRPRTLQENSFSEFETYGTFVAYRHPDMYRMREWHSIRYGAVYFIPEELSEEDYRWIGRDFDAISFEKGHAFAREIHDQFYNPKYRNRLSAKTIVKAIQESSEEGMEEIWEADLAAEETDTVKISVGVLENLKCAMKGTGCVWSRDDIADVRSMVLQELQLAQSRMTPEQYRTTEAEIDALFEGGTGADAQLFDKCIRLLKKLPKGEEYLTQEHWRSNYRGEYTEEVAGIVDFMIGKGRACVYNYPFARKYKSMPVEVCLDEENGHYYAMYKGHRMYMPKGWDRKTIVEYFREINMEQDAESPHAYGNTPWGIKPGDVVVDAGVAEGNFALDIVETAGTIIMFEPDPAWVEALQLTFKDYDNVILIDRFLGARTEGEYVCLNDLDIDKVDFIKMDIEGAERDALTGATELLARSDTLHLAVCAYHYSGDEEWIENFLRTHGCEVAHSKGFMFPEWQCGTLPKAELRRGLIYGRRIKA